MIIGSNEFINVSITIVLEILPIPHCSHAPTFLPPP